MEPIYYSQYYREGRYSYEYIALVPILFEGLVCRRTMNRLYSLILDHVRPPGPTVGQYTAVYTVFLGSG